MGHLCPPQKDPPTGANSGASRTPGPDDITEPLRGCRSGLQGSDEPKSPVPAPAHVSCASVPCCPESQPRGHFSKAWAVPSWPVCAAAPRASPHLSSTPEGHPGPTRVTHTALSQHLRCLWAAPGSPGPIQSPKIRCTVGNGACPPRLPSPARPAPRLSLRAPAPPLQHILGARLARTNPQR